uniref:Uncharacterized protein n=1 Tax=Cannabis sativa TaxID=3483 RepID=A0A803PGU7_CANSA
MRLKKRSTPSPPAPTRNSKKIHANTHLSYNNIPLSPPTLPPLKGLKAFLDESIPHNLPITRLLPLHCTILTNTDLPQPIPFLEISPTEKRVWWLVLILLGILIAFFPRPSLMGTKELRKELTMVPEMVFCLRLALKLSINNQQWRKYRQDHVRRASSGGMAQRSLEDMGNEHFKAVLEFRDKMNGVPS